MFPPLLLLVLAYFTFFFWPNFSHLISEPWHQVWTQMLSQILLCTQPTPSMQDSVCDQKMHLQVLPHILPENSSWAVHPAVSIFELGVSQPESLLSSRLTHMYPASCCWMVTCSLSDAVYALSSPSSGYTFSTVGFASVFSVLPLMVFPSLHSNRFILKQKWIFNCCFIDFGLMSLWCFTPLSWLFCRLCFLKANDIPHH